MKKALDPIRSIFNQALQQVDVASAVAREMQCSGATLTIANQHYDLGTLHRIAIIAVGKAAVPMSEAALHAFDAASTNGLAIDTFVVAPARPNTGKHPLFYFEGSHPLPNAISRAAADAILTYLQSADDRTLVLYLISGGASSMMERPLDPEISVAETAEFYQALVLSGLPIAKINILRKHFSAVKGGRLAEAAAKAAAQCTLILSDVAKDALEAVGSGPSVPDPSTLAESLQLLQRLRATAVLPQRVLDFFNGSLVQETPKPCASIFSRSSAREILSSEDLAAAAANAAANAGFHVETDNTCDDWDYREAGRYLLSRSAELSRKHSRSCLISVGEVTVRVDGPAGRGGRNQHLALWSALEIARTGQHVTMLSAGSDGIDGNSPAAGAVVDQTTVQRALQQGIDPAASLSAFNSFQIFSALGDTVTTAPTGNNLRDLRILLTDPSTHHSRYPDASTA